MLVLFATAPSCRFAVTCVGGSGASVVCGAGAADAAAETGSAGSASSVCRSVSGANGSVAAVAVSASFIGNVAGAGADAPTFSTGGVVVLGVLTAVPVSASEEGLLPAVAAAATVDKFCVCAGGTISALLSLTLAVDTEADSVAVDGSCCPVCSTDVSCI